MASQPPRGSLILPQPAPLSFLGRVRSAWGTLAGQPPLAQPLSEDPTTKASPEEPAAPVPVGVVSRALDAWTVDPNWLKQLAANSDSILNREGGGDLKLYDAVLDDTEAAAAFQQRRLAVIARPWEVEPGDDSALATQAADFLRENLKRLPWDHICDRMLYGRWFGYGVGEALYEEREGKYWIKNILVPDRAWFAFTNAGELRLKTRETPEGEALPPNKFWAFRTGASHDFAPYGVGIAHWCYWPVWFKRNVIKFWAIYLEKFGLPTALATFPQGSDDDVIKKTLEAAAAVGRDSAVAVPDNVTMELLAEGRSSNDSYQQFCDQMDDYLRRIILSQTGTSKSEAQGLGGSQSDVMKDVRDEIVRADSDMLHESFNSTIAKWITEWNFGEGCPVPKVYRNLEDQEDLTAIVARDVQLKALGWIRTEESARETYGEGYERAPEPQPPAIPGQAGGNVVDMQQARERLAQQFAAGEEVPLYVSRKLKASSARALLAWASAQGIPNLEPAADLHVTILYSKTPVDPFALASDFEQRELTVSEGGPRAVAKLGEGAIVLRFASNQLEWRHREMIDRGASHDYDDYRPHITVAYAPDFDPAGVEPFQGELAFGPEIFAPIEEDWKRELENASFSAEDRDQMQRFAARLAREADPVLAEFAASLKGRLDGVRDTNQLRVILLDALEQFPAERLGELTGLPFVAVRAAAAVGAEGSVRL